GEFPEKSEESPKGDRESGTVEGIQMDDLTPEVAQQLGLPSDTRGVVITDVAPDSTAAEAGLRRGDVIQEINRKPVKNLEDYGRIVRTIGTGEVLLLINRSGTTSFVVVQPR
ncbi:MAG: PDZ domain-containing protein, partial [Acidobacteria bacterium]|nr:PDZ domain-containing protein [Acidobacteriota bacterium]